MCQVSGIEYVQSIGLTGDEQRVISVELSIRLVGLVGDEQGVVPIELSRSTKLLISLLSLGSYKESSSRRLIHGDNPVCRMEPISFRQAKIALDVSSIRPFLLACDWGGRAALLQTTGA
ncbi:hypothetical protein ZIOFF_055212 [Zingiber officinale]|uniref:Uncharacterized protein n=1 Tax=Zingiber officinale TaxID=94328 RepID=A0A8J5KK45_ZINOF|nr:hypothetical protein ZIOFF_055212 [Zingiber officinale]